MKKLLYILIAVFFVAAMPPATAQDADQREKLEALNDEIRQRQQRAQTLKQEAEALKQQKRTLQNRVIDLANQMVGLANQMFDFAFAKSNV